MKDGRRRSERQPQRAGRAGRPSSHANRFALGDRINFGQHHRLQEQEGSGEESVHFHTVSLSSMMCSEVPLQEHVQ